MGCETYKNDSCSSINETPVSICRAQLNCQLRKKTTYDIGFRTPARVPENYGVDMGQTQVTETYNECVNRNLEEQRAMQLVR